MTQRFLLTLLTSVALFTHQTIEGWWAGGHMTVAQIAYDRLEPEVKAKVDDLIDVLTPYYPMSDTFVKASTWLDDIHNNDFMIFKTWHYTTTPYDPDGILTGGKRWGIGLENQNADIRYGLQSSLKTLRSPKSNSLEKALLLRYLVHCVADAHQPLHTTSLYSKRFPNGDIGGNLFKVKSPIANTLHLLWDSGLGAIPVVENGEAISQASINAIAEYASDLTLRIPEHCLPEACSLDIETWIAESHELAKTSVYTLQPNTEPPQDYMQNGRAACELRLVLAGYRLAHLLNNLFK